MTSSPPAIAVGPLLRHVDPDSATVWLETSRPCEVHVVARPATPEPGQPAGRPGTGTVEVRDRTWGVHGHHFVIVHLDGLAPGAEYEYSVSLDGVTRWPEEPERPSLIRTPAPDDDVRLAFGSCRRGESRTAEALHEIGADALAALATKMADTPRRDWPDALLLLGDQVYADIPSRQVTAKLDERRAAGLGPQAARESKGAGGDRDVSEEICDFEEYSWLYHESWDDPDVRWLLSTVPSCMILDDHDLRDDWNTSYSWRQEMTAQPWWRDRVVGALSSYFVYQHLGNLSPDELEADETYQALRAADSDAEREELLAEFAVRADAVPGASQWSYHRDFGRVRVVMLDVRASRMLEPGRRRIMDDGEWEWTTRTCLDADVDHLLIGSSLPAFMLPALHHLEGWNETHAQNDDAPRRAAVHEKIRRAVDLEHWAAFRSSFDDLVELLARISRGGGAGERPPASILMLGGDVHCSYLEEVDLGKVQVDGGADSGDGERSRIHQLVMSPFRNPLEKSIRVVNRLADRGPAISALRALARTTDVGDSGAQWSLTDGIWFDNGVMTLVLHGRDGRVDVDHATVEGHPWWNPRRPDPESRQVLRRRKSARLAG